MPGLERTLAGDALDRQHVVQEAEEVLGRFRHAWADENNTRRSLFAPWSGQSRKCICVTFMLCRARPGAREFSATTKPNKPFTISSTLKMRSTLLHELAYGMNSRTRTRRRCRGPTRARQGLRAPHRRQPAAAAPCPWASTSHTSSDRSRTA